MAKVIIASQLHTFKTNIIKESQIVKMYDSLIILALQSHLETV